MNRDIYATHLSFVLTYFSLHKRNGKVSTGVCLSFHPKFNCQVILRNYLIMFHSPSYE